MSRSNIKLPTPAFERHERRKKYYGLTWEQYLDAGCPEIPAGTAEETEP